MSAYSTSKSGGALAPRWRFQYDNTFTEGFSGMDHELSALKTLDKDEQKAVQSLWEYLNKNKERLRDTERLAAGRSIPATRE